ncbi:MAG: hypothetical protein ACPLYF_01555 [Fervidobacterium sp.]
MTRKELIVDALNIAYSIWVLIVLFFVGLRIPFEVIAPPDITNIPTYMTSLYHIMILAAIGVALPKSEKPGIFYLMCSLLWL